jgi:hypothetical protein
MKSNMKTTLDTNCLIDLELAEGSHLELRSLIDLHDEGKITICIPAIGASERLPDKTYARTFRGFQARVNRLSNRRIELLNPLMYVNIAYLGHAVLANEALVGFEESIHDVLFPNSDFKWKEIAERLGLNVDEAPPSDHDAYEKWRNRKCDALCMWCHIHYGNDIFVTRDSNFHKQSKKGRLIALGAKSIAYPSETLSILGIQQAKT